MPPSFQPITFIGPTVKAVEVITESLIPSQSTPLCPVLPLSPASTLLRSSGYHLHNGASLLATAMPQEVESHCGSGTQLPSLAPDARKGKKGRWEPGVPGAGGETDQLLPTQPGVVDRRMLSAEGNWVYRMLQTQDILPQGSGVGHDRS